jgi:Glyoxalase-like domain
MARLKQIVVDCNHPASLARFWAAALEDFEVRAYDDAEIERLAALGYTPETDPVVILDGPHVELCFQKTDPPPTAKKPMHLDIQTPDRADELRRLVDLGASINETFEAHAWMRDPEGNDFCVVDA